MALLERLASYSTRYGTLAGPRTVNYQKMIADEAPCSKEIHKENHNLS